MFAEFILILQVAIAKSIEAMQKSTNLDVCFCVADDDGDTQLHIYTEAIKNAIDGNSEASVSAPHQMRHRTIAPQGPLLAPARRPAVPSIVQVSESVEDQGAARAQVPPVVNPHFLRLQALLDMQALALWWLKNRKALILLAMLTLVVYFVVQAKRH